MLQKVLAYILKNRSVGKRTCFDIKHLREWMEWAIERNYIFVSKDKDTITGVITIYPIGKWSEVPNMQQVIDSTSKNNTDTDYFIMDALTDSEDARREIVNKILERFKDIESNPDTQIYASIKNKIIKFNKQTILTLKN